MSIAALTRVLRLGGKKEPTPTVAKPSRASTVSELEIFCQYNKVSHTCIVESYTVPVYAFEYSATPSETPGLVPESMTRGCKLNLIPNTMERLDDFTEVRQLKPEYYADDQARRERGPPAICQHNFEYAQIESDSRVKDRDLYGGRFERIQLLNGKEIRELLMGTVYHYFSHIPRMDVLLSEGDKYQIYLNGTRFGPYRELPRETNSVYKIPIDKDHYAVFFHYYMLVINANTKETTVLRM